MRNKRENRKEGVVLDRKSIIRIILIGVILSFLSIVVIFGPRYFRNTKLIKFNGRTTGTVLKIEPLSILYQGFNGQNEHTYYDRLTYVYEVANEVFTNTNSYEARGKYANLIESIRKSKFTRKVNIAYNEDNPQESLIMEEER